MVTPPPRPDLAAESDRAELSVLEALTGASRERLWSIEEVALEVGNRVRAEDALAALHRAGLIHRTSDGFVSATRAAIRAAELGLWASL